MVEDTQRVLVRVGSGRGQSPSLPLLHVSAGLLLERFLNERDSCAALGLSQQFRQIAESPDLVDERLKVLYRTLAARWQQISGRSTSDVCGFGEAP